MTARPCILAVLFSAGVAAGYAAQQLERINPSGLSTPQTYTHVVKAGKTLYIAGQVGAGPDGKIAGPTMAEQLQGRDRGDRHRALTVLAVGAALRRSGIESGPRMTQI